MGWLFGHSKKVPKVPLPQRFPVEEGALRFPDKVTKERIIEPGKLKEAAGVSEFPPFMEREELSASETATPRKKVEPSGEEFSSSPTTEPLFIQLEVYREVLGTIDTLKRDVNQLHEISKSLELSEYNEENNFTKLRRGVKVMHDRFLDADKILFKS